MKVIWSFTLLVAFASITCGSVSKIDPAVTKWLEELRREREPSADMMALVNIKNGTVRGFTSQSIGLHTIYEYLGVPYAKAPLGQLRFQAPQPYEGWGDDIYNATRLPHSCPQFLTNITQADEDCLFLSIHSRRPGGLGTGPFLPVLPFNTGLVHWASTGDDTVSANNGMKDMVQGLRWVQENIHAFGGDKNKVTVMGESAGGIAALYMLISPLAQGLFHKVVSMSGTPLIDVGIDRDPVTSANQLGETFSCNAQNNVELASCLREVNATDLAKAGVENLMKTMLSFKIVLSGSSPVIEGNVPGAFLTDDPLKLLTQGPLPDVPVVLGTVQHEGSLPLGVAHYLVLQPNETEYLNNVTYMRDYFLGDFLSTWGVNDKKDGASISQSLALGFYKPGADPGNFTDIQYELLDLLSAVFLKAPILRTADILARRLSSVYLYSFEYYNQYDSSLYNLVFNLLVPIIGGEKPSTKPGICHADDLIYMFRLPFVLGPRDLSFSRTYVELFTNFIISGTPTPEASDKYPAWPTYNIDTKNYMVLRESFTVRSDFTASWRQGMPGEN